MKKKNNNNENDVKKKNKSFSHSSWNHQISRNFVSDTGQNGPLALIFEIFSNRALFRK